ncbi:hypothetical protein GCM10009555_070470 [Acrocarpospora macrocephala]|uniref:Uncharacterized protein n=1 Tax=Acrocarpospora macrocephala TaxID=150177 RepID=A0A5M3X0C0_9ACTN|nr:creatininase family protein [Acrocarpospora macrocephala]GES13041.1 hypothetical protein Amac_066380 [Acrocarpospora macrocephala]
MNRLVSRYDAPAGTATVAVLPVGRAGQDGHRAETSDTPMACAIAAELSRNFPLVVLPPVTIFGRHDGPGTISRTLSALLSGIYSSVARGEITALVMVSADADQRALADVVQEANAGGMRLALFPTGDDWAAAHRSAPQETTEKALVGRFRAVMTLLNASQASNIPAYTSTNSSLPLMPAAVSAPKTPWPGS